MGNVFAAKLAELVSLQTIRIIFFVLAGRVVSLLADRTGQVDNVAHVVSREAYNAKREAPITSALNAPDA
jgi:hypothetical protein